MRGFIATVGVAGLLHAVLTPLGWGIGAFTDNGLGAGEGLLIAAVAFAILFFWGQNSADENNN